jgi:hypothetical protein
MEDTDWRPSLCPHCKIMRDAARYPVCKNEECSYYGLKVGIGVKTEQKGLAPRPSLAEKMKENLVVILAEKEKERQEKIEKEKKERDDLRLYFEAVKGRLVSKIYAGDVNPYVTVKDKDKVRLLTLINEKRKYNSHIINRDLFDDFEKYWKDEGFKVSLKKHYDDHQMYMRDHDMMISVYLLDKCD